MDGLGDVVKAVTTAVGIKPCTPCERRRQRLNQLVPFKSKEVKTMTTSCKCDGINFCPCCGHSIAGGCSNYCFNCGWECMSGPCQPA